jgi:hypothetical protein
VGDASERTDRSVDILDEAGYMFFSHAHSLGTRDRKHDGGEIMKTSTTSSRGSYR